MNNEFCKRLVDMYGGNELPEELEKELKEAAYADPELTHDMMSLRMTVEAVQSHPGAEFTEESNQRILMKIYARGVDIQTKAPAPTHLQYQLPIRG
jgi:hypothetical protein